MNIAEILKNCPEGMKLYSSICGNVELIRVNALDNIEIRDKNQIKYVLYPDGRYSEHGEVVLFPSKEQRDWNKFLIPFKDGDIIISTTLANSYCTCLNIAIFKEYIRDITSNNRLVTYCQVDGNGNFRPFSDKVDYRNWRLANQAEKDNFFEKLAESGYCWTGKELIKQFKFGDIVAMYNEQYQHIHIAIFDKYVGDRFMKVICTNAADSNEIKVFGESEHWYTADVRYATEEEKEFFFNLLKEQGYVWTGKELKKKFDLCSLKPYDKVLAKSEDGAWYPSLVSWVNSSGHVYLIDAESSADYVIPFEGNEHLIGKWDDPDPYYITWE